MGNNYESLEQRYRYLKEKISLINEDTTDKVIQAEKEVEAEIRHLNSKLKSQQMDLDRTVNSLEKWKLKKEELKKTAKGAGSIKEMLKEATAQIKFLKPKIPEMELQVRILTKSYEEYVRDKEKIYDKKIEKILAEKDIELKNMKKELKTLKKKLKH